MSAVTDLTAAVAKLKTDVAAKLAELEAKIPAAGDDPAVVQAVADLNTIDATVQP